MFIKPLVTVKVLAHVSITNVRTSIALSRPLGLDAELVGFAFIRQYNITKLIGIYSTLFEKKLAETVGPKHITKKGDYVVFLTFYVRWPLLSLNRVFDCPHLNGLVLGPFGKGIFARRFELNYRIPTGFIIFYFVIC